MCVSPFQLAFAGVLLFSLSSEARVAQPRVNSDESSASERYAHQNSGFFERALHNIGDKRESPNSTSELDWTSDDLYKNILDGVKPREAQSFCNIWLRLPPKTDVVEYTPTVTATTSASTAATTWTTERLIVTKTVVDSTTTTAPSILPRDVAAVYAVAHELITSVLEGGVNATGTAPAVAVTGLSRACSIKRVGPTSTVTSTFTAPAEETILGMNRMVLVTLTTTKSYTTTTTLSVDTALGSTDSSNALTASRSDEASTASTLSTLFSSASSIFDFVSRESNPTITPGPQRSLVPSGSALPTETASALSRPVVIGIPFSCPTNDRENQRQIVGDLQYKYTVLCNTAIVASNPIATIPDVENEFACAAECSLINNRAQKSICAAAVFTPIPGTNAGSCLINGPVSDTDILAQSGTTTVLLSGVSSKSDDCSSVDLNNGPQGVTIDITALVASVTAAGFSLSIPNLVNHTETGGVFRSTFTSDSTDSRGFIHRTSNFIYVSSSAWWKVYESSWVCSATVTHPELVLATSSGSVVNTGFVDAPTTAQAASATQTPVPTKMAMLSKKGSGLFTMAGQTATTNITGGADIITPSPSASNSAVPANGTTSQPDAAAFTTSSATYTSNSTGGEEIITPSQAQNESAISTGPTLPPEFNGTARVTSASSTVTSNSAGGTAVETPLISASSTGTFTFSTSSALVTFNSTGGAVVEAPTASTGVPILSTLPTNPSAKSTSGNGGYAEDTTPASDEYAEETSPGSGGYAEETSTGSGGYAEETSSPVVSILTNSTNVTDSSVRGESTMTTSAPSNQTILPTTPALSVGQNFTMAGNASITSTTGGEELIAPGPISSNVSVPSGGPVGTASSTIFNPNSTTRAPTVPETAMPSSTDDDFTNSDDLRRRSRRSSSASVPPTGVLNSSAPIITAAMSTGQPSGPVLLHSNLTLAQTTGVASEITNSALASQGPSSSANLTGSAPASMTPTASLDDAGYEGFSIFATDEETSSTPMASGSSAIIISENKTFTLAPSSPSSPGANSSAATNTGIFLTLSETMAFTAASGTGIASPSANSTAAPVVSSSPPVSSNASASISTGSLSTASATTIASATSGTELVRPINSTLALPPSFAPSLSANASIPTETGSGLTALSVPTSGTPVMSTSANITAPASITPSPSANISTFDSDFTNSGDDRLRSRRSTLRANSTVPGTALIGTATGLPVNSSSTLAPEISMSSNKPDYGYGEVPTEYAKESFTPDIASTTDASQPSITLSPISLNSSTAAPLVNTSTDSFNPNDDDRRRRSRSSSPSSGAPTFTPNATLPGTALVLTSTSAVPTLSTNSSELVSLGSSASAALNSTQLPIGTASSTVSIPPFPTNSSSRSGTGTDAFSTPPLITAAPASMPLFSTGANVTSTSTSVSALETPLANSTATEETPTTPESEDDTPFTAQGVTESASVPSETANSTGIFLTGVTTPLASLPTPLVNTTLLPWGTGSSTVPAPSVNSIIGLATSFSAPASSVPTPSGNISVPVGTGSSSFPSPSTNDSLPVGTGSIVTAIASSNSAGIPTPSSNITILASLLSSSPKSCPTEPSSAITRTTQITTVITQIVTDVVPAGPATCLPTASSALWVNSTQPAGTGAPPLPLSAYSSYTFKTSMPTPLSPPPRRRTGEIATPEQIAYACSDTQNLVRNGNFESEPAPDWTIDPQDSTIAFTTVPSSTINGTTTSAARVQAGASGRSLTASQALTLCPGRQYILRSVNRQANMLSKCEIAYFMGDDWKFTAGSQEQWLRSSTFFTAGESPQDVSVDLRIVSKCNGEAGMLVGANENGYMVVEFDDVEIVPDLEA